MKRAIFATCLAIFIAILITSGFPSRGVKASSQRQTAPAQSFVRGRVLVKFAAGIVLEHAQQIIAGLGARDANEIPGTSVHILELPDQASEMAFVHAFQGRPEVEFAELDQVLPVQQMIPNDPVYADSANSWSLQKIKGPEAWALDIGSSDITIAILDTGVDGTHEDLIAKMVPGWNVYNNNADTSDVIGHGTGVAGAAAASSNNGIGIASVAWECRLMPIRISDPSGYASYSAMASGLTWAANHGARVANISYNVTGSSTVSSAAKYFQGKGGVVASAAGNDGLSTKTADDPYILTVGATDASDVLYAWSNRGNNLDVVAPGNASVTMMGGGYGGGGGTSFASPLVAGAAALILSVDPSLTPGRVQEILKQSADDLGPTGWDPTYGSGRLNLERAVIMALGSVGGSDVTSPSISITSPGQGNTVSGIVTVAESTSDDVGVVRVDLYVDGTIYGSTTTAPFNIKWNTRKAPQGSHVIQSRAFDGAGNLGDSAALTVYK